MEEKKHSIDAAPESGYILLCSVYDKVAEEYGPPFVAKNQYIAGRFYRKLLGENDLVSSKDYALYCVGHFNPSNGNIIADDLGHYEIVVENLR